MSVITTIQFSNTRILIFEYILDYVFTIILLVLQFFHGSRTPRLSEHSIPLPLLVYTKYNIIEKIELRQMRHNNVILL